MKEFPTSVALSAITGKMVHEPFSDVHACLNYLAGESVWTHQLPRVSREAQAWAIVARPDLAPAMDEAKSITRENWREFLAVWLDRYGPIIALPRLNSDEHERIDALSELAEQVHPKRIVIVNAEQGDEE